MNFTDLLFYGFAGLTLLFGFLTVANPFSRNPVTNAMFLVLTIAAMAGLFVLLNAFFLAAIQVLVYAGAVMVLFLFVIMLLDLKEEDRRRIKLLTLSSGTVAVAAIAGLLVKAATATVPLLRVSSLMRRRSSSFKSSNIMTKRNNTMTAPA